MHERGAFVSFEVFYFERAPKNDRRGKKSAFKRGEGHSNGPGVI